MKLSAVEIKKVVYVPVKYDSVGGVKEPATATITLVVPAVARARGPLRMSGGRSTWGLL